MRIEFPRAFLFSALRWLERMGAALRQARKWLLGRFCWRAAAETCWRDALTFGRMAGYDLKAWRWTLWERPPVLGAQCRHCLADLNAHGLCSCVAFETQLEVRGQALT